MENISFSNTSEKPIYQQLYEQISSQILNGTLKSDTPLPSIRKTSRELRVSIITIKKTWELLEREGYIYTLLGKGSYVSKHTKANLDTKKIQLVKETLKDHLVYSKQLGLSQEDIIKMIEEIYPKLK